MYSMVKWCFGCMGGIKCFSRHKNNAYQQHNTEKFKEVNKWKETLNLKVHDRELKKVTPGEFVISLVLSHRSKNLKEQADHCYSSVLLCKQRKIHPQGVRAGRPKRHKEKRGQKPNFGSSFYMFFSSSPWACPV